MRVGMIEERRARGENPFPHKFHVSTSLVEFAKKYGPIVKTGEIMESERVSVAGIIYS